jgi:orotate phosphoribosyltransferase
LVISHLITTKSSHSSKRNTFTFETPVREIVKHCRPKSIGGLEIGSIPLTIGVVLQNIMNGKYKKGPSRLVIRKNPKTHGLEKRIEGALVEPIVIVDDVVTSGQSCNGCNKR